MRKYILPLFLTAFLAVSCKDYIDEVNYIPEKDKLVLTDQEYTSIAYDNPKEISEEDILNLIKDFQIINAKVKDEGITRNNELKSISLVKKYYISRKRNNVVCAASTRTANDSEIVAPMYEVKLAKNDKTEDFAIVCGDERAAKVLFYGEDCLLTDEMNIETRFLVELSKRSVLDDIEFVEEIKKEKRDSTLAKIGRELNIPLDKVSYEFIKDRITTEQFSTTRINPPGGVDEPTKRVVSYVAPMSKVTWNQIDPYNTQMPIHKIADPSRKSFSENNIVVGCANVAIATLFSIIKPAITGRTSTNRQILIDWDYVTSEPYLFTNIFNPSNNSEPRMIEMIGSLMRSIYNETKSYPDTVWVEKTVDGRVERHLCTEMTSTLPSDMIEYLQNKTNYSANGYTLFNAELVKQSLAEGKPVLLWGSGRFVDANNNIIEKSKDEKPGHAWLIDGFIMTKPSGQVTNDLYWSVNMGWGKDISKGYFKTEKNYNDCNVVFPLDKEKKENIVYYTIDQRIIYDIVKK